MGINAVITRGFLFSIAFVVTAGYTPSSASSIPDGIETSTRPYLAQCSTVGFLNSRATLNKLNQKTVEPE